MTDHKKAKLFFFGSLILLFFGVSAAYLRPDMPLVWQVTVGLGVVFLLAWLVQDRTFLGKALSKKTNLYGINSIVMSVVVLAIAIFANMIANKYDVKWDMTSNKLHTLSDQSVKVVRGLDQPIVFKVFVSPAQQNEFSKIVDKYTYHSQGNDMLKTEYIDVDKDPFTVQKYDIKRLGTIVVESQARSSKIELSGPDDNQIESKITNALIQVSKGGKKKVYFTTGHGERLVSEASAQGYSQMKQALASSRFDVEELISVDKEAIPADAEILIVAGPKKDFMKHELDMIEAYIKKGGKALVMVEPDSTKGLKPWLEKFGVKWTPGETIIEMNVLARLAGGNPLTPVVTKYDAGSQITKDLKQISIFDITTPIEKSEKTPEGYVLSQLFSSSDKSKQMPVPKSGRIDLRAPGTRPGPVPLAVAVSSKINGANPETKPGEAPKTPSAEFRMVVVGDSDFGSNRWRNTGVNGDLFQNMLSWLAEEEDLIAIRPKETNESKFEITQGNFRTIYYASVFILPLLMLISGLSVWITRRRK